MMEMLSKTKPKLLKKKSTLKNVLKQATINFKKDLAGNLVVPQAALKEIESLMPEILKTSNHPQIEWIKRDPDSLVFSLVSHPKIIFKTQNPRVTHKVTDYDYKCEKNLQDYVDTRINNTLYIYKARRAFNLDMLIIPNTTPTEVKFNELTVPLIAEERLIIEDDVLKIASVF